MKTLFNLTLCDDELLRFRDTDDLLSIMDGFDGVELTYLQKDSRKILPHNHIVGLHMHFFPCWLDFWHGNRDALLQEFGSQETWEHYYGGTDKAALLQRFREDLNRAHYFNVEYVVFHVSDSTIEESFTCKYHHTDAQVIDAATDLLNELFADEDGSLTLLVENLWQPGLTFTNPRMTQRLMEQIKYPNKGIMLDTGHLLHTNTSFRTQEDGLAYINQMLDEHGELNQYIRGIHLNQSLTGELCEQTIAHPPIMASTFEKRHAQMFWHAFAVDKHEPFTCAGVDRLIERISPEYLTFEFITKDRAQLEEFLAAQKQIIKKK